jgi:hypothetical protein
MNCGLAVIDALQTSRPEWATRLLWVLTVTQTQPGRTRQRLALRNQYPSSLYLLRAAWVSRDHPSVAPWRIGPGVWAVPTLPHGAFNTAAGRLAILAAIRRAPSCRMINAATPMCTRVQTPIRLSSVSTWTMNSVVSLSTWPHRKARKNDRCLQRRYAVVGDRSNRSRFWCSTCQLIFALTNLKSSLEGNIVVSDKPAIA